MKQKQVKVKVSNASFGTWEALLAAVKKELAQADSTRVRAELTAIHQTLARQFEQLVRDSVFF